MATGFILINTAPHREQAVLSKLKEVEEIEELYLLFGGYDMIVRVEARDFDDLGHIVLSKIRAIEGVIHTETLCGSPRP